MASFHNIEGQEIKIQTPIVANVLPFLAFGITAGIVYKKTKSIPAAIGYGVLAGVVGLIPRAILVNKALNDVQSANQKSQTSQSTNTVGASTSETTSGASNDDGEAAVKAEDILNVIEKIAAKNKKQVHFKAKKNYFLRLLQNLTKRQKIAAYNIVLLVEQMPANPSEQDTNRTLEAMAALEDKYGKDFLESINNRLKHISNEISASGKKTDSKKTTAA